MESLQEYYRNVIDNLDDGLFFVDRDMRITFWNKGAEELTGFKAEEVIGINCFENALLHVDRQGNKLEHDGCPVAKALKDEKGFETDVFLNHKQGFRILVSIKTDLIKNSMGEIVGAMEVLKDASNQEILLQKMSELEKLALLDPLTKLANRRHTIEHLRTKLDELSRYGRSFGVLFIDIDRFKKINDKYGHDVGDLMLKNVSSTLSNSLRPFDFLGRWGGDEFVAVVVNVDQEHLAQIADRARRSVEQTFVSVGPDTINATVSIGADLANINDTVDEIIRRTDLSSRGSTSGIFIGVETVEPL
jgi:diguanylate cyclase (GGDEF)-like protein/PAS domain S-box-containing protein